jgi:RimJ/RimL family protein N-acetyltransferase
MAQPDAGRELLRAAKASASHPQPALSLPVGTPPAGLLRPVVTRQGAISEADVRALSEWRNRFVRSFQSEFVANVERTERWLVETVGSDDSRILFMVDDLDGRTVGYLGLAFIDWETGYAEADAVVRGGEAPGGLFTRALHSMWRWARAALGLSRLGVRVRSDNSAIVFYENAGFRQVRRVPLRLQQLGDERRWVEDPSVADGGLSLVYMELEEHGG